MQLGQSPLAFKAQQLPLIAGAQASLRRLQPACRESPAGLSLSVSLTSPLDLAHISLVSILALRLNSPVGVGGRWEADVDAGVDVLFTVLHCSMYCLQCGV